jgi:hypothetical protein
MESKLQENQGLYRSVRNAATLRGYYPDSARGESKPDTQRKPVTQRMSHKQFSFVVEWQMYNHLSGTSTAKT